MENGFSFRKHIRACVSLKVDYKILGELEIEGSTLSKDLSTSGINILVREGLEGKPLAELKIYLPSVAEAICVNGRMLWQKEVDHAASKRRYFATGMEFTEMRSIDKNELVKCVIGNLKKESEEADAKLIDRIESMNWNSTGS